VNVGNRVKPIREDRQSDKLKDEQIRQRDDKMRQQSLDEAQWIPACLLEMIPNQQTGAPLSPEHTMLISERPYICQPPMLN
jgi:hypothetical protein